MVRGAFVGAAHVSRLYDCLLELASCALAQYQEYCARPSAEDGAALAMYLSGSVRQAAAIFEFLQEKQPAFYCGTAAVALRATDISQSRTCSDILLAFQSTTAIYRVDMHSGRAAASCFMGARALEQLRSQLGRKPAVLLAEKENCRDGSCVPKWMAFLAIRKLPALLQPDEGWMLPQFDRTAGELSPESGLLTPRMAALILLYYQARDFPQSVTRPLVMRAEVSARIRLYARRSFAACTRKRVAVFLREPSDTPSDKDLTCLLYPLADSMHSLSLVCEAIEFSAARGLINMLRVWIWRALRRLPGSPADSAATVSHLQQGVSLLLYALEKQATGVSVPLLDSSHLQQFLQSVEQDDRNSLRLALPSLPVAGLLGAGGFQDIYRHGMRAYLHMLGRWTWHLGAADYVPANLCIVLYKLRQNFIAVGALDWGDLADALSRVLDRCLQEQRIVDGQTRRALRLFFLGLSRNLALPAHPLSDPSRDSSARGSSSPCHNRSGKSLRLILPRHCCLLLQLESRFFADALDGKKSRDQSELARPLELANGLHRLLAAEQELSVLFSEKASLRCRMPAFAERISVELKLLVEGAQQLKVYRVAALGAVLLESYQQIMAEEFCLAASRWQTLILRGHRKLAVMLNQAAAHQEVSSARPLIAAIYHWLETQAPKSCSRHSNGQSQHGNVAEQGASRSGWQTGQLVLARRETGISAGILRHLDGLAVSGAAAQQRIQRDLFNELRRREISTGSQNHLIQLREMVAAQTERLQQMEQHLGAARRISLESYSSRFERLLRRLSSDLERPVILELADSISLDRVLLEFLLGPLEHLLSNAVIHGAEPPEQRKRCGKAEITTIQLSARLRDEQIAFSVVDDGAGICTTTLLEKARELQIPDAGRVPVSERWRWLLLPGFTTSSRNRLHAGRGLGLEAVMNAVSALQGSVHCDSRPGNGTRFELLIPSAFAG